MLLESLIISLRYVLVISFFSNTNCLILSHHHHHNSPTLFIFGDSYLDVGNNNYINTTNLDKANFWPYGITYFHSPTGRFSDGRLISDFIAEYANLPLIHPYLQPGKPRFYDGVNFASAGGGALVETFQGSVIDLHMQLRNYKKVKKWLKNELGDVNARNKLKRAVYLFSIGTNDYLSLFTTKSSPFLSYPKSAYVSMVVNNITSVINDIYKIGGRKFVLLNLPPVGCLPSLRMANTKGNNGECQNEISTYIMLHNKVLRELPKHLPGFKYALFDFHTSTFQRIKHPSKYGFKEGKTACCGTGRFRGQLSCGGKRPVKEFELCRNIDDHVFWDSLHFTQKTYNQISDEMWNNVNYIHDSPQHSYNIKHLFHVP